MKTTNVETAYQPKPVDYENASSNLNFLQGEILTIIEATGMEGQQLKAVKDLVKNKFSFAHDWIAKIAFPELPMAFKDELKAGGEDLDFIQK